MTTTHTISDLQVEEAVVRPQSSKNDIGPGQMIGSDNAEHEEGQGPPNSSMVICCISCITFISCYLGGLVTVSVPQISNDLQLDPGIELWYVPYTQLECMAKSIPLSRLTLIPPGPFPCTPSQPAAPSSSQARSPTSSAAAPSSSSVASCRVSSAWPAVSHRMDSS